MFLALALAISACDKDGSGAEQKSAAGDPAGPRDALLAAWKKGGLVPSAMTPAQVEFGSDCRAGTVNGIGVLLCAYASPAEAKAAEEAGYGWVGAATGISQARGALLIAAADRDRTDPSGRTLDQLTKLAPK